MITKRSVCLCRFVLPPKLDKVIKNFSKVDFRRGERTLRKRDLVFEYPKRNIYKSRDYAHAQANYMVDVMMNVTEETRSQFRQSVPSDSQPPNSDVKRGKQSLMIMQNLCPNHTSSQYNYKRAVEVQAERITAFAKKIRAPWRRDFTQGHQNKTF